MSEERTSNEVLFISGTGLEAGEVEIHKGVAEKVVRSLADVKEDWRLVVDQVAEIFGTGTDQVASRGYRLSEVEVSLGFDARGRLAFIAEAGVRATVSVKFERVEKLWSARLGITTKLRSLWLESMSYSMGVGLLKRCDAAIASA
jgi:hypothetical protein